MSRKVVRLTLDHLAQLTAPCTTCLFWQLDPVSRGRVPAAERAAEKEAWVSHVLREWGSCGRVALVDARPVGYAIYAPPVFLPGAGGFQRQRRKRDQIQRAVFIVGLEQAIERQQRRE